VVSAWIYDRKGKRKISVTEAATTVPAAGSALPCKRLPEQQSEQKQCGKDENNTLKIAGSHFIRYTFERAIHGLYQP